MKYYLIAGEASGDLHASHLMQSIKERDPQATFRYYGGDLMQAQGGMLVHHYRDLAYMGFIPVLLHLRTILKGMEQCKQDIQEWQPDALILIDYPGFNLKIAKFIHTHTDIPVYYYISPKIWAWKEHRIKEIKQYVAELFSILPFEVPFFEKKHHYPIHYVGNPTVDEISEYLSDSHPAPDEVRDKNYIALLPGSRRQEIEDNLTRMIEAAQPYTERYQLVIAGAPGIEPDFYNRFVSGLPVTVLYGQTYAILQNATAALVTSGTATLEAALFRVPQVVCYYMNFGWLVKRIRPYFLKIPYISLVNLIADSEVVPELVASDMNAANLRKHLESILPEGSARQAMLQGYEEVAQRLGKPGAPDRAAEQMLACLRKRN